MKFPVSMRTPSQEVDRVGDTQEAFGGAGQSPVVFEGEVDAVLLGLGQAFFDGVDAPFETFVFGVAG